MKHKYLLLIIIVSLCFLLSGCDTNIEQLHKYPEIFPDYTEVTVPVNIAPLNFSLRDSCRKIKVYFILNGKTVFKCTGRNEINIPAAAWRNLLAEAAGSSIQLWVCAKRNAKWYAYAPFNIFVATDSIDSHLAYRLIDPGYEMWDQMGIYIRNLQNFDEQPVITNNLTSRGCMNCHSFHNYNPDRMMFHSRGEKLAGTFLLADGVQYRINTKTEHAESAGTYPAWHPSGKYIAFSSNVTRQTFHVLPGKKIEVYDLESDLILFDIKNSTMLRDQRFTTKETWETFPAWSPDGKWLYFCTAQQKEMPFDCHNLKYALCRVQFDAETGRFGNTIDSIITPKMHGKSISFPRISPNGRYLLYTASDYATFPIWHSEAQLEMLDIANNRQIDIQSVNSNCADSYHAWSSNSRWIVFSSRRIDGLYTRPFFAYFDNTERIHKPFILPQNDCKYYGRLLKSFNIPEFVKGNIKPNPYEITETLNGKIINLTEITE